MEWKLHIHAYLKYIKSIITDLYGLNKMFCIQVRHQPNMKQFRKLTEANVMTYLGTNLYGLLK